MESLSRPPHRRKHSSVPTTHHPYDDVLLSNGNGKTMSLRPQEYAEIFAASSSIPVLDLSSLDNSGLGRSSGRVDYSNIFGGLRNDDVALPYEELIRNTAKERSQADARSPSQESGSLHSSSGRSKRSSTEASDQSPNGVKQQINLSFNKTSQINKDESNGKTHIAQFHAVPAFTRFVDDEASKPQKKVEDGKRVSSLKREVSRTWSFSAEVEAINKSKAVGLNWDKSHTPEKLCTPNELELKSQPSKVPPFDCPSKTNDKMDSRQSKLPTFVFEEGTRGKSSGENSPEFFDGELDENSVAAVSAAHLKKAIDHAQEIIRIAKMMMERSREGLQDVAKPSSKSRSRVMDKKKVLIEHEVVNHLKDKIAIESFEKPNPMLTGLVGKLAPSFRHSDPLIDTRMVDVERVMDHAETAKEHAEVSSVVVDKICIPSGKIEQEKQGGNVESVQALKVEPSVPGLVANTESRDVNLMSRLVENINSMLFRNKPAASPAEMIETGKVNKEDLEVLPDNAEGSCELAENGNSELNHELERSVIETSDQVQTTLDHSEEPVNDIEQLASDFDTFVVMLDMVKNVEEKCEIVRASQVDQVLEENAHATNEEEESDKKTQQTDEMVKWEDPALLSSEINNSINGSRIEEDSVEQEEMKHKTQYVDECRENDQGHGDSFGMEENVMRQIDTHQKFGSGAQLNEDAEREVKHRDPEIIPDIEEVDMKDIQDHESETDKKRNDPNVVDGEFFPGELEIDTDTSDSSGSTGLEADNPAAVQNSDQDASDTKVEDNHHQFEFQEVVYDYDVEKAVDASSSVMSSISDEDHHDDRPESYDLDLADRTEECQNASKGYRENVIPSSGIEEVKETDHQSHIGDIEMSETLGLSQTVSEENVVGSKIQNTSEGATFDGMDDYFVDVNAGNEEKLPKDQDGFETADEISDAVEQSTAEIHKQNLRECPDDNETAEFDITYMGQEFERTSGSDGESVSTSTVDNTDGISGHESEESTQVPEDMNSNKDAIMDDIEMDSTPRKSADEQTNAACSALDNEPKDMEKTEGDDAVIGPKIENSKENLTGSSTMRQKDAKEKVPGFDKDDHRQRIEAIKKGREREKHRIAADRAIREARERAFAEARERAERAAVEKAAAEARQRAIAEAREKHDKASIEAKMKAERAAVEKVTAEALERAREKAWSQKTSSDARKLVERSSTEKFTSSRNNELKHSVSSSDLEAVEGTSTDSAQRQKAKLEKHNRIMERAAKALEEKNMRDLIAQKEQAERHRISHTLDAEVKRWAMGKEGNLRALLSTLQYILGTNSGWQPISLTDIITTAEVKKAYRKATLYVHPDKLQQRGASIQQKYVCEKVFDLLKAAWNKFNSEER